jgi:hypothetical protein
MYRIYFGGNEGDNDGRYDPGIPGSLSDIHPIADKLHDEIQVALHDNEELEVEAVLEFDTIHNTWMARPLWDTPCRFDTQDASRAGAK